MRKFLPQSRYARNVLTLMTGTGLAQAIPIAISPILTRLYSPEEFGLFAFYMAVVSITVVLVTGRYEQAILLPRQDRDAGHIAALVVLLSAVVSAYLLLLVILFNSQIVLFLGDPKLAPWLYWVPASTFLMGTYQGLNYWSNRKTQYKRLAISRTVQSGSAALAQLSYARVEGLGLVAGQVTGQVFATSVMARLIWREDHKLIRTLRPLRSLALARKYINFPKYLIVAHGFNTASGQMPVLLLNALFSAASAGFFTLTQRVMGAPMALVAGALGDVFRQEASQAYSHQGNCLAIYKKTLKRLLLISVLPFLMFFFIAPDMFAFVFGGQWRIAGEYAQILTLKFFFDFVAGPLSAMFMIAQKQRLDLLWQMALVSMAVGSFYMGFWFSDVKLALMVYAGVCCCMQAINLVMSYCFAKNKKKSMS
ncbi:lipopolysaccharide biosynthesis protein [Ectopseudomonas mendocina]